MPTYKLPPTGTTSCSGSTSDAFKGSVFPSTSYPAADGGRGSLPGSNRVVSRVPSCGGGNEPPSAENPLGVIGPWMDRPHRIAPSFPNHPLDRATYCASARRAVHVIP